MTMRIRSALMLMFIGAALFTIGCDPGGTTKASDKKTADTGKKDGAGKHEGWWCDEHGIPEAECSMCSSKVAKECKAKGDWCEKHDRAKSQCFICEPKLKEKFAAIYRAKEGKDPPPIEEEKK